MINISDSQYLMLFLCFWLAHFTRQSLVYLHLWQKKEYRWDRLRDEFRNNKKMLFPKASLSSFLVLVSFLILPKSFFMGLTTLNFIFWGGYALLSLILRRWIYPQGTKKVKLFFLTIFLGLIVLKTVGYLFFPHYLMGAVLVMVIIFPVMIISALMLMEVPVHFVKRRLMAKALQHRQNLDKLTVIGIAGSYGKTSVKDFLHHFLALKYGADKVAKTPKNTNTQLGVAQTILNKLTPNHLFFVCETGAYCRGEVKEIAALTMPQIGILTGLNAQHLSLFGSMENAIQSEYEIIESLPQDGLAVFNGDNLKCRELYQKTDLRKIIVGSSDDKFDWRIEDLKTGQSDIEFRVVGPEKFHLKADLVGGQNSINIMLAASVAMFLGLSSKEVAQFALSLPTPSGGPKMSRHGQASVIKANYSSNPDGALAHVNHLRLWSGRKVLISFGFIELGEETARTYYQLGESLGRVCDLAIFTRNVHLDQVKKGIASVRGKTQVKYMSRAERVIEAVKEINGPNDVILLEGRINRKIIDHFHD